MAEQDPNRALHFSEGKPGVDQIPPDFILALGEVFSYGEKKYFRDNWKRGNMWHEFYGSALRHLLKFWTGEDIDPESHLRHLAHAAWNVMALMYYHRQSIGTDDRWTLGPKDGKLDQGIAKLGPKDGPFVVKREGVYPFGHLSVPFPVMIPSITFPIEEDLRD